MGFLVVLLTVLGVCVFVAAGLAFERRFGRAIDAWVSGAPKPRPKTVPAPRRWTEAQLFEPVAKWVEDAEREFDGAQRTASFLASVTAASGRTLPGVSSAVLMPGEFVVSARDAADALPKCSRPGCPRLAAVGGHCLGCYESGRRLARGGDPCP